MMIFDSLTHITGDGTWFDTGLDASLERLLRSCGESGVSRALLVGLPGIATNDLILSAAEEYEGLFVPIAGFNPIVPEGDSSIREALYDISKDGFRGIKLHPRFGGYHPLEERVKQTISEAGKCGLAVLICTVWNHPTPPLKMPVWQIMDELCRINLDTKIVFLHGGYLDFFAAIEALKGYDNALLDLSCTFLRYMNVFKDKFLFVFNKFDKKVVIGSDYPENTFSEVLEAIDELNLQETKKNNILHNNLEEIFVEIK